MQAVGWHSRLGRTGSFRTNQNRHSLWSEVPTRVAILYESTRYSSHKANDDSLYRSKAWELG